jgi:hypothetical protein
MVSSFSAEVTAFDDIAEAYASAPAETVALGGLSSVLGRAQQGADDLIARAFAGEQDLNAGYTAFQSATEEPEPIKL